jgi:hypothetical protein
MLTNIWKTLYGTAPGARLIKGNVAGVNADGSYTVATSDGGTILARPLPSQTWTIGDGVFVMDGRMIDVAPALDSVTQTV